MKLKDVRAVGLKPMIQNSLGQGYGSKALRPITIIFQLLISVFIQDFCEVVALNR